MKTFKISTWGVYLLICCFSTLFAASKPMAYAACVGEFQQDCDDDHAAGLHHVMRRSIQSSSQPSLSLKVDFMPLVHNVTYYNTGDQISFSLNLTHNQSASADITKQIKVMLSSQYLMPVSGSLTAQAGSFSGQSFNASAVSFDIPTLNQSDSFSASFEAAVAASIQPLSNLYFTVLVWGRDTNDGDWHYGPVPSLPTLYAVFPTVTMTRTSYENLWVSNTTGYSMVINMPKLNFSLLVEITTNINDFSFMELHNVQLRSVGSEIKIAAGGFTPNPTVSYDSSEEVPFNDRAVMNFGNLTVLGGDDANRNIIIEYNVTIRDHPLLENNSKHWVGAGMRSGYQMLWVGQEALYVYKSEPSLEANFTTLNETAIKRYLIGDKLFVDWNVQHTYNTSYEDAENVRISFYSSSLKILNGTYNTPGSSVHKPLILQQDEFHSAENLLGRLAKGERITGNLALEVSNRISPLDPLDIFLQLKYENVRGEEKLNTTVKPSPPYVAGVPLFCLKNNASINQIRIGGRATFLFSILMKRIISTLRVEVILPVNGTSIMSLVSLRVISVGKNILNYDTLSRVKAQLNSTVGDSKLYDRGVLDFGRVENELGDTDHPDNKIMMEFEIIVNDHANVTNGSKHWVGVGVRGGKRMMWIGDVALIADVPQERRPILKVSATCALPGTQLACKDATSLTRSSKVYFNGTVYHDQASDQYAGNVNVFWMMPPYVHFSKRGDDSELSYQYTKQGPKFSFNKKLRFLDRLSFSVEGDLDPDGLMPPGDNYAVSPIQLFYSSYGMSAVYGAPLVPVTLKFRSPENGAPEVTPSDLPEIYKRGFLLDTTNNILYVCQQSNSRSLSSCFSTSSNEAVSWTAMDQQVCHVIGLDGNDVYGIACNNRAYMRKRSSQGAWYGIAKEVWVNAKTQNSNISATLVTIDENYSHSSTPPEPEKMRGTGMEWGANTKGVYMKSDGNWKLKAQWKCCGN